MSSPFVAEISMFGFNFPPRGWAFCQGQLLPISQNTALFSLVGTYYGGDGKATFGLPDLTDSVPIGAGQGGGLSQRFLGEAGGEPTVTLLTSEIPAHNHNMVATTDPGTTTTAAGNQLAQASTGGNKSQSYSGLLYSPNGPQTLLSTQATGVTGSSLPHNNMMPFETLTFCIAMQGVFPPRSAYQPPQKVNKKGKVKPVRPKTGGL